MKFRIFVTTFDSFCYNVHVPSFCVLKLRCSQKTAELDQPACGSFSLDHAIRIRQFCQCANDSAALQAFREISTKRTRRLCSSHSTLPFVRWFSEKGWSFSNSLRWLNKIVGLTIICTECWRVVPPALGGQAICGMQAFISHRRGHEKSPLNEYVLFLNEMLVESRSWVNVVRGYGGFLILLNQLCASGCKAGSTSYRTGQ